MLVEIPDAPALEIQKVVQPPVSLEAFVVESVREKLAWESRRRKFYWLSDETRAAMLGKGLTEADILKDFEDYRQRQ
jgi:hypothetical protein